MRGLTAELAGADIDSLLLNIHDQVGGILAERLDFVFSPTYLVFAPSPDGTAPGAEVLRSNSIPTVDEIRRALGGS